MQDPAALFAPYALDAIYAYRQYGDKGARVIVLEVRETDAGMQELHIARHIQPPESYGASVILDKKGAAIAVSGEGIQAALANPARFAQWCKELFRWTSVLLTPIMEKHKDDETIRGVGHRDSADDDRTSPALSRAVPPTPKQLQQARDNRGVAREGSGSVGGGSDQGVLL